MTSPSTMRRRARDRRGRPRPRERARDRDADRAIDKERVLAKRAQVQDGDYFAILGLGRDAPPHEVARAFERLKREFAPGAVRRAAAQELADALVEIGEVLDEAHRVLADDAVRASYRALFRPPDARFAASCPSCASSSWDRPSSRCPASRRCSRTARASSRWSRSPTSRPGAGSACSRRRSRCARSPPACRCCSRRRCASRRLLDELRALAPDAGVVVAYGKILPPEVLAAPQRGCLNVHASLLAEVSRRGADPVGDHPRRARDRRDADADGRRHGHRRRCCSSATLPIDDAVTAGELHARLAPLGAEAAASRARRLAARHARAGAAGRRAGDDGADADQGDRARRLRAPARARCATWCAAAIPWPTAYTHPRRRAAQAVPRQDRQRARRAGRGAWAPIATGSSSAAATTRSPSPSCSCRARSAWRRRRCWPGRPIPPDRLGDAKLGA